MLNISKILFLNKLTAFKICRWFPSSINNKHQKASHSKQVLNAIFPRKYQIKLLIWFEMFALGLWLNFGSSTCSQFELHS